MSNFMNIVRFCRLTLSEQRNYVLYGLERPEGTIRLFPPFSAAIPSSDHAADFPTALRNAEMEGYT